jgi:hypothetical protein
MFVTKPLATRQTLCVLTVLCGDRMRSCLCTPHGADDFTSGGAHVSGVSLASDSLFTPQFSVVDDFKKRRACDWALCMTSCPLQLLFGPPDQTWDVEAARSRHLKPGPARKKMQLWGGRGLLNILSNVECPSDHLTTYDPTTAVVRLSHSINASFTLALIMLVFNFCFSSTTPTTQPSQFDGYFAGAAGQHPRPCPAPSPMALPQYRNFSTSTTVPTASITPTNSPKSTALRNKTASKSHKRPNQKKRALSSSMGATHLAASKGGGQKLNYFDMKGFLASGAAERPWFQLLMELAVAEDQDKVLHPADLNRLVVRALPSLHGLAVLVCCTYWLYLVCLSAVLV